MTDASERPRDRMLAYVQMRLSDLQARARIECLEPTCGSKPDDSDHYVGCNTRLCGHQVMLSGWRRERDFLTDVSNLIDALDAQAMKNEAKGRKR